MAAHLSARYNSIGRRKLAEPTLPESTPSRVGLPHLSSLPIDVEDSDGTSSRGAVRVAEDIMSMAADYDWPRSSPLGHSTDEVSPVFPERPIRPLPKRKLRSRLSSEQAGAISYPPMLSSSSPLFGSPQSQHSVTIARKSIESHVQIRNGHDDHTCDCGGDHGSDIDSEDDENGARPRSVADGYESFENTNNKKKRKIPLSGMNILPPSDKLLPNAKHNGIDSNGTSQLDGAPSSLSSTGSGLGFSGPGRGRLVRQQARPGLERRPLGASTNALNAYSNGHTNKMKRDWNSTTVHADAEGKPDKGIISAAMASAAENGQKMPPLKGQENVSLLQRQRQASSPGKDFTFECKSDSSNKLGFPQQPLSMGTLPRTPQAPDDNKGFATQGTQTSLQAGAQPASAKRSDRPQAHLNQVPSSRQGSRRVRRPEQEYAAAARQRQMQQDVNNYHHPPRKEDIWICEFCEYEAIWGKPPAALVRQYEIKDRRERKAAEERRRLLEKAKAKGRKNKKGGKGAKSVGQHTSAVNQGYDSQYDNVGPQDHDSQGEEFFDDDDYDEGDPSPNHASQYEDDVGYDEDRYPPPLTDRGG